MSYVMPHRQKQSPVQKAQGIEWQNRLKKLFNVLQNDLCRNFYYKNRPKLLHLQQQQSKLLRLPLFSSLFEDPNTIEHKYSEFFFVGVHKHNLLLVRKIEIWGIMFNLPGETVKLKVTNKEYANYIQQESFVKLL